MLSNFFMISSLNGSIILAVFLIAFVAIVLYSVLGFTRVLSDTVTVGDPVITYKRIKLKYIVLFIFVIGLIIRFVCAALFDGSIGGMYGLVGAFRMFQSDGLNGYSIFNADTTSQIYPLAFYINSVFGWLGSKFGDDTILYFFMRVPFIMADLGSAFLLYFITKKYINIQSAVIVLALFLLNPLFFINSSIDSRVNSILILALLCTFYFMVKRNVVAMLAFYGVSLLLDRGAQYVFAPIAVYTVYLFVRAIINVKKDGAKDYLKDNSRSPMLLVPLSIIGVFLAMWLVSLPLVKSSMGFNPFKFLVETFIVNIKRYELFGLDALSLYNLFGRNGQALSYNFNGLFFGITFLLLSS
ncbi:MAG: hypothetical protein LBU60_00200, partial [Clostridiales bacterium]|nr:hypothetical protein [Clostridiales bacterium]